jgi:APA family basic amino acid/polyamine antiporter
MFVAYTGYGRIATLGAEVRDPARIIPRAVIVTLAVSFALYMAVAAASIGAVGAAAFHAATVDGAAPLERVADAVGHPWLARLLAFGALTAMLGVLLNLVLGLSRVVFAMGGRGDLPAALATTRGPERTPTPAILVVGIVVIALIALQDVKATWSFSAFTVLVYYALTNLAALGLPADARRYPRVLAWIGLLGCTALAFAVDLAALRLGGTLLAAGVAWRLAWINIPGRTGR